jgi:hypothetical protein
MTKYWSMSSLWLFVTGCEEDLQAVSNSSRVAGAQKKQRGEKSDSQYCESLPIVRSTQSMKLLFLKVS